MPNIPYVSAPKNACALACYTMVAKYFFPETTFDQIAEISEWEEGYVPRPARKESKELFHKAWLEAVSEPELCVYTK